MAGEYVEFPEELIHHIQSFLDPKQAARTSVLSKLWYSAWSTNPILCLHEEMFPGTETRFTDFQNFARRSIDRYQKLSLKLNTFKLSMFLPDESLARLASTRFGDELIFSSLTLDVNDLYVDMHMFRYTLPQKVFSSTSLQNLHVSGCIIDLPQSGVLCSRLVSLELSLVRLSDDIMRDIILGCPLIEDLRVTNCVGLKKISLSTIHCNLRTFHAKGLVEWVENNAPGLQLQFHNLISLKLNGVKVDNLFFKFFSHRFPRVEILELQDCIGPVANIDIASNSLRCLSLIRINGYIFAKVQVSNVQHQYHNLISLKLIRVEVNVLFFKSFSHMFPRLEKLEIEDSVGPHMINIGIGSNSLKYLSFIQTRGLRFAKVQVPNVRQRQYHNLISLKLSKVEVDDLFFKSFAHRFPCLEELEIEDSIGPVINIDIASNTLKYLSLFRIDGLNVVKVQALNIENFRFESTMSAENIPSISINSHDFRGMKSDMRFYQPPGKDRDVQVSWLLMIRDILRELSLSKISIAIVLSSNDHHIGSISEKIMQSNHTSPFVENLNKDIFGRLIWSAGLNTRN